MREKKQNYTDSKKRMIDTFSQEMFQRRKAFIFYHKANSQQTSWYKVLISLTTLEVYFGNWNELYCFVYL